VNFNYLGQHTVGTVSQYTISQTDGSLNPMTQPTVLTGENPNGVTVDPLGRAVYVANSYPNPSNSVSQYTINQMNGSLTPMNPATVLAGNGTATVTVNPSGTHAYVTNYNDNSISQYNVNQDGSLTLMPNTVPAAAGGGPNYLVVDPSGKNVYVANLTGGNLYQFVIGADGSLGTSVATFTTGIFPRSIAITPNGAALYVANGKSDSISQFTIGAGGALTPMTPPTVSMPTGSNPNSITVDPSAAYAYVANRGSQANGPGNGTTVSQYSIAADGSLQALTPPTVPAGPGSTSVVVAR
jgi:6-phosphogluconolactonase (cycloisomerase 2 family)